MRMPTAPSVRPSAAVSTHCDGCDQFGTLIPQLRPNAIRHQSPRLYRNAILSI